MALRVRIRMGPERFPTPGLDLSRSPASRFPTGRLEPIQAQMFGPASQTSLGASAWNFSKLSTNIPASFLAWAS